MISTGAQVELAVVGIGEVLAVLGDTATVEFFMPLAFTYEAPNAADMMVPYTTLTYAPGQWKQLDGVLGSVPGGYVHLTVVDGFDAFYAYGVVNDGATSSSGTNDGSYVPMTVSQ